MFKKQKNVIAQLEAIATVLQSGEKATLSAIIKRIRTRHGKTYIMLSVCPCCGEKINISYNFHGQKYFCCSCQHIWETKPELAQ